MSIKNYSVYSTDAGMLKIDDILNQEYTKRTNKAVITDLNTLMGVPEFIDACTKKNIDPVIGVTVSVGDEKEIHGNITLYAKNKNGFDNLKKIVSSCVENNDKDRYTNFINIINNSSDLIAVIGGHNSVLYNLIKNGNNALASRHIYNMDKVFKDNLKFEIQVNHLENEENINKFIIDNAEKISADVFPTTNNRMKNEGHYPLLIEKIKMKRGVDNKENINLKKYFLQNSYIKSEDELKRIFEPYQNRVSNIDNIFKNVEKFSFFIDQPIIPTFPEIEIESSDHFINILSDKYKKFIKTIPEEKRSIYSQRLKEEITLIKEFNFEKYFIIFDQIEKNKLKDQRFNLRGSSVSFLTTHVLGLSDIDPVKNGLLPERFLNRNRLSRKETPDIDLESDDINSVRVYLKRTFGDKNVSYLASNNSIKANVQMKMAEKALREDIKENPIDNYGKERVFPEDSFALLRKYVSAVYQGGSKFFDELYNDSYISKWSAVKVFNLNPDFNSKEFKDEYYKISNLKKICINFPEVKKILGYIKVLDSVYTGQQANRGSIVVSNNLMSDFFSTFPVKQIDNNVEEINNAIELDKKYVERMGLIKLDILSNLYLGKLNNAYKLTNLKWDQDDYENQYKDKAVYDLIGAGHTATINQLKSEKQQELSAKIKITNFEELVSLIALIRPAIGQENVDKYIFNKENPETVLYENDDMKDILGSTHGIIIFEEQIMEIAQKIGGFSKGDSDELRSLMKKVGTSNERNDKYNSLEKMKKNILKNAIENKGLSPDSAKSIMDKLDGMQGYTFSKAHSLSYAALIYKQAHIDVHYPAEYIESYLLDDKKNISSDKEMKEYLDKSLKLGRIFLNLDINRSLDQFKTRKKGDLLYIDPSLNYVIKDQNLIDSIIQERKIKKFDNIYDFVERTIFRVLDVSKFSGEIFDGSKYNSINVYKNNVINLVKSGAFDSISPNELKNNGVNVLRDTLINSLEQAIDLSTNPYNFDDFVYQVPENSIDLKKTISNEVNVYGFSPLKYRDDLSKLKVILLEVEKKISNLDNKNSKDISNKRSNKI